VSRRARALALGGLGAALVAVAVAVALSLSARGGEGGAVAPAAERPRAPDVAFTLAGGERRALASFRGRPAVLGFVLPYCASCIETLRALDAVAEAHSNRSVVPIAVNTGLSGAGELREFAADVGASKALYVGDPDLAATSAFGVTEVDTVIVIDAEGRVLARGPRLSAQAILQAIRAT
jgi:hypothetical protein